MRVFRFVVSGGIATAANLTALFVLTHFLDIWYVLSSAVAFTIGFGISFVLQKYWTFEDTSLQTAHIQAALFFAVMLAGLGLNTALVYILVEFTGIHYIAAQLMCGIIIALCNFFSYQHLVFRKGPKRTDESVEGISSPDKTHKT